MDPRETFLVNTRRDFMTTMASGLGGTALASLLAEDGALTSTELARRTDCHSKKRVVRALEIAEHARRARHLFLESAERPVARLAVEATATESAVSTCSFTSSTIRSKPVHTLNNAKPINRSRATARTPKPRMSRSARRLCNARLYARRYALRAVSTGFIHR